MIGTAFGAAIFGAVLGPRLRRPRRARSASRSRSRRRRRSRSRSPGSRRWHARRARETASLGGARACASRQAVPRRALAEHAARHALRAAHRPHSARARRCRLEHVRDRRRLLRSRPRSRSSSTRSSAASATAPAGSSRSARRSLRRVVVALALAASSRAGVDCAPRLRRRRSASAASTRRACR